MHEERGFRALPKQAPETGVSLSYQRGQQKQAWNAKAAAAATKKPVCKHRSLSTLPLPGACAARHWQGPVIQGQLPRENTWHISGCCNVMPASAATGSPRILYPYFPVTCMSQSPLISCSFNPIQSGQGTDALRWSTCRSGANSKAEPQELCKQRREREINPSSLRSSGLNLHNQLDVPCICGIPEETMNHPEIETVDVGSNCRLGVCFLHLICFWFYVYFTLVFRVYIIGRFVYWFGCSLPLFFIFCIVFSTCYHWWICFLVWLSSSFIPFF